jgi:hypothetical protein
MSEFSGLFLAPLIWFAFRTIAGATSERNLATYSRVRRDILARQVEPASRTRCTVMDWRADDETLTLVVQPDASAMIYALKQEGTMGDPKGDAQGPARRFLQAVDRQRIEMHATRDYREPPAGYAAFWIVDEDETLTSGDVPIDELKLRLTGWTGAWGSGRATVYEIFESFRLRQVRRAQNVAAGPRSV